MLPPAPIQRLTGTALIQEALSPNPYLHLYGLGDLDPRERKRAEYYGFLENRKVRGVVLKYRAPDGGTIVQALCKPGDRKDCQATLEHLGRELPKEIYAHLSPGLDGALQQTHSLSPRGSHVKMALRDPEKTASVNTSCCVRLGEGDVPELRELYDAAYPDGFFEPSTVEWGPYFGIRESGQLMAVAGVHVYSEDFGVAALANIATLPKKRGRGLAKMVTAALCQYALGKVQHIGLNVAKDNVPARACYGALGFEDIPDGEYFEGVWTQRPR